MRSNPLLVLAVVVSTLASFAPARSGADDAGASTFQGAKKRYATKTYKLEEIPVPKVELKTPANLPSVPDAGPGDTALKFPLTTFQVSGNTLLLPSRIDEILKPFEKPDATIADVEAGRDALQKEYEEQGFLTVAVMLPQQTIGDGQVRLDIVENRLGKVTVSNDGVRWFNDDLVRRDTPHLVEGSILRKDELSQDMATANRNPDRDVRPVLKAGEQPGTADLALVVEDKIPLHGSLIYNNYHTPGSPETRMISTLSYANLWGLEHSASVSYQFAPEASFDQVQIYSATYAAPMPWNNEQSVFGYFVHSNTGNNVTSAPGLGVTGKGTNAGLRFLSPLPDLWAAEGFSHSASFGADRKDIQNALIAPTAQIITPITYIPFSAGYNANLITDNTFTGLRLGLSFNFGGMTPGGSKTDFQINRGGVRDNNPVNGTYQIFTGNVNFILRIPPVLEALAAGRLIDTPRPRNPNFNDDWTFNLVMRGQAASQPLISTEQFAAGGVDTVRGYLQSEAFGDDAINVQAEFRTPYYRNFLGGYLREAAQLVAFYDGAELYTLSTGTATTTPSQDLQGVGVGVRASFFDHLQAEFFVAHPRTPTLDSGNNMWRYYFQVGASF